MISNQPFPKVEPNAPLKKVQSNTIFIFYVYSVYVLEQGCIIKHLSIYIHRHGSYMEFKN